MAFISEEDRRRALALMAQQQGLSGIFMRPPPPVQATPSTPLPGIPLDSPVVAPQMSQYDEFAPARMLMQRAPQRFAPTGVKGIDDELTRRSESQRTGAENFMGIIEGAQADPRVMAILQAQRERSQREMAELDKDKKRSGWDALARAGIAMAKSNSPYFVQALASGMEAGLEGLDEAKLKRDEKRSRLQAAEENTILAEIKAKQEAQDRSVSIYNAAIAAGKTESQARDEAIKSAVAVNTLPQQLRLADLEVETAEATLANKKADTFRTLNPVRSGGGGGGGGGSGGRGGRKPMTENQRLTKIAQLNRERRAAIVDLNTPGVFASQKKALEDAIRAIDTELESLNRASPLPAKPASPKAAFVYIPGKGLQPVK